MTKEEMFKQSNRYLTRGVNSELDIQLQIFLWGEIDKLKAENKIEIDYLQVFRLKQNGESIIIEHSQEVPEYKKVHNLNFTGLELERDLKIFVIDSTDYSTMLLAEEY